MIVVSAHLEAATRGMPPLEWAEAEIARLRQAANNAYSDRQREVLPLLSQRTELSARVRTLEAQVAELIGENTRLRMKQGIGNAPQD